MSYMVIQLVGIVGLYCKSEALILAIIIHSLSVYRSPIPYKLTRPEYSYNLYYYTVFEANLVLIVAGKGIK